MGLSGIIWAGFVFVHMAGNMLILVDPGLYNAYGHSIVSNKALLFGTEGLLVAALITHAFCALSLTLANRKAKQSTYSNRSCGDKGPSLGSTWMAVQGSVILVFVILHLATFKYGTYYETTVNGVVMRDLSKLIIEVFKQPGYVVWYLIALFLLGIHLTHGVRSIFQSFGLLHPAYQPLIRKVGMIYALIVATGFISQPVYVFLMN